MVSVRALSFVIIDLLLCSVSLRAVCLLCVGEMMRGFVDVEVILGEMMRGSVDVEVILVTTLLVATMTT